MEKLMIVTASDKGGVGKSLLANGVLGSLRATGHRVAAFDGDAKVRGLLQVHGTRDEAGKLIPEQDPCRGVACYDMRDDEARALLAGSLASDAPLILHDQPGGASNEQAAIFEETGGRLSSFAELLREENARLIFVHLVSNDAASVTSIRDYLRATEGEDDVFRHVAVINGNFVRRPVDEAPWFGNDGSRFTGQTRAAFLARGGLERHLPALQSSAVAAVSMLNLPLHQAARTTAINLVDRQRVKMFTRAVDGLVAGILAHAESHS